VIAGIDWGSVPEWFAFAAVLVAVAGYWSSRRDREREQASAVFVELTQFRKSANVSPTIEMTVTATVRNTSRGQIVDVGIGLYAPGARRRGWWFRTKRVDWWTGEYLTGRVYYTIRGQNIGTPVDLAATYQTVDQATHRDRPALVLEFTDANGRRWVRWPSGQMSRMWRRNVDGLQL
jgi:hypothetical protein